MGMLKPLRPRSRNRASCQSPEGAFEQCYNAQVIVDTESMLVLVPQVVQAVNDRQQVEPMLEKLQALPEALNAPEQLLADAGYFSEANVGACEQFVQIDHLIMNADESLYFYLIIL